MEKWIDANIPDQSGKIAVITGANSGLGFETSKVLAEKDAKVIMTGRNKDKLEAAKQSILNNYSEAEIEIRILDLANLKSVHEFADKMRTDFNRIDILINNAGVMAIPKSKTKDGFEMQFGTNHLGHFALTARLCILLKNTKGSRIINISSLAARQGEINFDDIMHEENYQRMKVYRQSKLANLMFSLELNERLMQSQHKAISIAAHPGLSDTELFDNMKPGMFLKFLGKILMPVITQPAAKGALPQLYAATSPEAEPGGYYGPDGKREFKGFPKEAFVPEAAKDKEAREKLWELSEKLTGIKFEIK